MLWLAFACGDGAAGVGTICGFTQTHTAVPVMPTMVDRKIPGFERSTRYHRSGFTKAKVSDTWSVDCQGSFRWSHISYGIDNDN